MDEGTLPELVRRYARSAIPDSSPPSGKVRVTQVGDMTLKPGGRQLRFEAVEEFSIESVGFAWRARFPVLGPLAFRVIDSYQPPEGLLEVRVLGIPVQRNRGPELAQGEAFRYLAELPWVPPAILANNQLGWREFDERTAEVSTEVDGQRIALRLVFNGTEIVQTIADRPRLEANGAVTPWIGEYRDYASFNGYRLPSRGEVRWELADGPFTYWRGSITSMEICA